MSVRVAEAGAVSVLSAPRRGGIRRWARLIRSKPLGALGGVLVVLLVLTAVFAPLLAPYGFDDQNITKRLQPPSADYPLGTDSLGRDVRNLIIYGARISMFVGLGAVLISVTAAVVIGTASGYFGGWLDTLLQRFVDAWMSFPWLVIVLTIAAILGSGLINVILLLGLAFTFGNSRVVRSAVLSVKEHAYIEAARATGAGHGRIIRRHILPNIAAPVIVIATLGLGNAILAEASLSFLGLGVPPPDPSWGRMLSGSARTYMERAPWLAIFPGIALSLAVFGFNMFGDALRDLLDPRLRGTR
jgi:peptide/nickel transport system permease protein